MRTKIKRLVSLVLVIGMVFNIVPLLQVKVYAKTAGQLTEAEAFAAGLDVYVAWYNYEAYYNTGGGNQITRIFNDKSSAFNKIHR